MVKLLTKTNEMLVFTLAAIFAAMMISNYFGQQLASFTYNVLNMSIIIPLVFFSTLQIFRNKHSTQMGKAWICFSLFIALWFVAEVIWLLDEIVYHTDPWPSEADYFWLAGYPIYFMFSAYYLKPFKMLISKKIIFVAAIMSLSAMAFSIYLSEIQNIDFTKFEDMMGLSYPILDALLLYPIIISLNLFFRGQVNFLWSMLMIGMLCFIISDLGFLIFTLDKSYYAGHPIDTIYLWAYVFFLFGSYSQINIFKKRSSENRFNEQENLK